MSPTLPEPPERVGPAEVFPPADDETLRTIERSAGELMTRAQRSLERRLEWYRALPAQERSWVGLIAQAGISEFVRWCRDPGRAGRLPVDVFGTAPRELTRTITLRQTVDLVRVVVETVEEEVARLAPPDAEAAWSIAVLRYSREVAFAAAQVYANAAEARGAWDARLESLVVDAVVRGETDDETISRATALGWGTLGPVTVVVGHAPATGAASEVDDAVGAVRHVVARHGLESLIAVQGGRLVAILGGPRGDAAAPGRAPRRADEALGDAAPARSRSADRRERPDDAGGRGHATGDPGEDALDEAAAARGAAAVAGVRAGAHDEAVAALTPRFGPGPVVVGPTVPRLFAAGRSARAALSGLWAAPAWPGAPRPVAADDLLPERALLGDTPARHQLVDRIHRPLAAAGGSLLETAIAYLHGGGSIEASAQALIVHPNTVRYRLGRIADVTGYHLPDPREGHVVRTALAVAALETPRGRGRRPAR